MLQWVLYVVVVTALLSISAWLAEQALRRRRWTTRWVWASAMGCSALLAYLSATAWIAARIPNPPFFNLWRVVQRVASLQLPKLTAPVSTATDYVVTAHQNTLLVHSWMVLSALLGVLLVVSAAQVFWRRRSWPLRLVCSACVGVSVNIGPAVVGLLRPTIVVPRWVLGRAGLEQRLILAHEQSHLDARDPLLLSGALVALMLMPWNLPLWWQLHRLRHAIEVDCDKRVLDSGLDARAYGEALIEVGQRRAGFIGTVAAMSEPNTLLEKRIEIMTRTSQRCWTYGYAILSMASVAVAFGATQIASPDGAGSRQEISVDPATLDRYAGNYQYGAYNVVTFTREGTVLYGHRTGTTWTYPIFPETPTTFFSKVSDDLEVTFNAPESGPATSATIHQAGHVILLPRLDDAAAATLEQALAARVTEQAAQPGSETALRKSIGAIQNGSPDYADMTAPLQEAVRRQEATLGPSLQAMGEVQAVEFKGVGPQGTDHYVVTYQGGKQTQWMILLDPDNRISTLILEPRF